jgi:uncharacterized protein
MNPIRTLSLLESRVLGVLVEKQHTVPDTYPLSLNSLTAGCNQKSSRDPTMEASDAEVQASIDALKALDLVYEGSGGRVTRYAHNFGKVFGVPSQAVALLTVLMLRGPQTLSELRIHSERIHKFADVSAVEGFLNELAQKQFVIELARAPGAREPRWAQLLCGAVEMPASAPQMFTPEKSRADVSLTELIALKARLDQVEADNENLKATVAKLCAELGVAPE